MNALKTVAVLVSATGCSMLTAAAARAQTPPLIGGLTGTIAVEGTVDQVATGMDTIVIKTVDGTRHLFQLAHDLATHGRKPVPMNDWLAGLRPGTTVVAHYTRVGDAATVHEIDEVGQDALKVSEGTVTKIDRRNQQITVRFEGNRVETLQLTLRAARGDALDLGDGAGGEPIVVYYTDVDGIREAHYFRKKN